MQMTSNARKTSEARCAGFTLVEVMIASAIGTAVLALALTVFIAAQRVLETAMAQVQLSFELRMLREKLLFNIDEEGGLMNARYSTVSVDNVVDGWGDTLSYKTLESASENVVSFSEATEKLAAESERSAGWLSSGSMVFGTAAPFGVSFRTGEVHVDADVRMRIGNRAYSQRQLIRTQLMSQ